MSIVRSANLILQLNTAAGFVRHLSNKNALLTKTERALYLRPYPTVVVNPDGSTYKIRHYEPRMIIKLPLDLSTVSEEEKAMILQSRKPVKKVEIVEEIEDSFDKAAYLKLLRRKAN